MKFESLTEKIERRAKWELWFAWYPIKSLDGYVYWLETVRRRFIYKATPFFNNYNIDTAKMERSYVFRAEYTGKYSNEKPPHNDPLPNDDYPDLSQLEIFK